MTPTTPPTSPKSPLLGPTGRPASERAVIITLPSGKQEVLYDPFNQQAEFHARMEPNVLFVGSRGTGKSLALRWEAHLRALNVPGFTYIILRRTHPELQKSHLKFITGEMEKLGGYFHRTDKIAYYPNGSQGFFAHCQHEKDVMTLLSSQFDWMGFDEISTFPWEMVNMLKASVRVTVGTGRPGMMRACTNPLGVSAEQINRYFVLKDILPEEDEDYIPDDWYAIKVHLNDNPHIDQVDYRKRLSGLGAHVRTAWLDGEFVMENALFDFYPRKFNPRTEQLEPYHVINDIDLEGLVRAGQIYRVYDHGYSPDPAYCAWIAHLGDRFVVFHERLWYKTIVPDIAKEMKETDDWIAGLAGLGKDEKLRVLTTYCDPSIGFQTGADVWTIKERFENNGVPMDSSVNKRDLFASCVHTALAEEVSPGVPRLQIYANRANRLFPGCVELVKAIPRQRYDPKRPLFLADSGDDHSVIALAYFLISNASTERRESLVVKTKRWLLPKLSTDRFLLGRENVKD